MCFFKVDYEWLKRSRMKPVTHHVDDAELQIKFHARTLARFRCNTSVLNLTARRIAAVSHQRLRRGEGAEVDAVAAAAGEFFVEDVGEVGGVGGVEVAREAAVLPDEG